MSRVSLIEKLYIDHKSAFEFDFDKLTNGVPMASVLSQTDLGDMHYIATSAKYSGRARKKFQYIDAIMNRRGFRRKFAGTNRLIYDFLDVPTFVAKVGFDRAGASDAPREYKNQHYIKPFCNKIFEVDYTGNTCFVEKVNPITSVYEFQSVADDIFNMLLTNIIGKYILDDIGTEKYMNYGIRHLSNGCTFGPVLIDFPYLYKLDGNKLICKRPVVGRDGRLYECGGDIDYDAGFNNIKCCKCGKLYSAMDLAQDDTNVLVVYGGTTKGGCNMRTRIVEKNNGKIKTIIDTGNVSPIINNKIKTCSFADFDDVNEYEVSDVIIDKRKRVEVRNEVYSKMQRKLYDKQILNKDYSESSEEAITVNDNNTISFSIPNHIAPTVLNINRNNIEHTPIVVTSVDGCKVMEEGVVPEIKINENINKEMEEEEKNGSTSTDSIGIADNSSDNSLSANEEYIDKFNHDILVYVKETIEKDKNSNKQIVSEDSPASQKAIDELIEKWRKHNV